MVVFPHYGKLINNFLFVLVSKRYQINYNYVDTYIFILFIIMFWQIYLFLSNRNEFMMKYTPKITPQQT